VLEIVWDEPLTASANANVEANDEDGMRSHFGSTVLERVVPASVNGKARYVISNDRIQYRLSFPLEGASD
jgi:two-component sensor histidine kinase